MNNNLNDWLKTDAQFLEELLLEEDINILKDKTKKLFKAKGYYFVKYVFNKTTDIETICANNVKDSYPQKYYLQKESEKYIQKRRRREKIKKTWSYLRPIFWSAFFYNFFDIIKYLIRN